MVINSLMKAAIISSFLVLLGCSKETWVDLGNGYAFITTNSYNHSITKHGKAVVYTNVVFYRVERNIIYGKRERSQRPDVETSFADRIGYGFFVINQASGELLHGMCFFELKEVLNRYGIEKDIVPHWNPRSTRL